MLQDRVQVNLTGPQRLLGQPKTLGLLVMAPHVDRLSCQQATECPYGVQFGDAVEQGRQVVFGLNVKRGDGFFVFGNWLDITGLATVGRAARLKLKATGRAQLQGFTGGESVLYMGGGKQL